jgi:molybdopterin molybdotransferase
MHSEQAAVSQLLGLLGPGETESMPLDLAFGRFTAGSLLATESLPGFDNSQVDGYALGMGDAHQGLSLPVVGEQAAGRPICSPLLAGQAIRIFTGAMLPVGTGAVVMQEDVDRSGDRIRLREGVAPGENIRRAGSDLCRGQVVAQIGELLTPTLIGVLASQGMAQVPVVRLPSVAILSTGDELVAPGQPLLTGQLYNSNGRMLAAMLAQLGIAKCTHHHCGDDRMQTRNAIAALLDEHDVLIVAGGVSVGDHDHVRPALADLGLAAELWRVKVKPGKPFLFSYRQSPRKNLVLGLPGNPVSAFVTFHLFVRPALLRLMGAREAALQLPGAEATLTEALTNRGDRPHYIRGRFDGRSFMPLGLQQSHALHSLSRCNALFRAEADGHYVVGERVSIVLIG